MSSVHHAAQPWNWSRCSIVQAGVSCSLLQRAIATWNETSADDRTSVMGKKLLRLANNLVAAMLKEKKAYLDRTVLDRQSDYFKQKAK